MKYLCDVDAPPDYGSMACPYCQEGVEACGRWKRCGGEACCPSCTHEKVDCPDCDGAGVIASTLCPNARHVLRAPAAPETKEEK